MADKKRVGIVCDNYKVERYRQELTKNEFTDFEVIAGQSGITIFKVDVEAHNVVRVRQICEKLEAYFANQRRS